MKPEEAIKVLTDKNTHIGTFKCLDDTWRKLQPAIDAAVNALEKQIPHHAIIREVAAYKGCLYCL